MELISILVSDIKAGCINVGVSFKWSLMYDKSCAGSCTIWEIL